MDEAKPIREIVQEHHESLFRYALALSGRHRHEAEGIVQQTYMEILEGRADLLSSRNKRAFLFGIARRIAASRSRRRSIWGRIVGLRPLELAPGGDFQDPESTASGNEKRVIVEVALRELPKRQLEVLTLVFAEGLTVEEAALAMGVSVGSARTHYHRAKKRLSQLLEEERENEAGSNRKTA